MAQPIKVNKPLCTTTITFPPYPNQPNTKKKLEKPSTTAPTCAQKPAGSELFLETAAFAFDRFFVGFLAIIGLIISFFHLLEKVLQ